MTNYNSRAKTTMHKTVCDACHKPCEVPFKPNGQKQVFCDACFAKTRQTETSDYVRRKDKTVFDGPDSGKPFQTSETFTSSIATPGDAKIAELKREINSVNAKLDKLIDLVSKLSPKKIVKEE